MRTRQAAGLGGRGRVRVDRLGEVEDLLGELEELPVLLILGVLEIPLGVLALAAPGAALAALVTVAGVWAVVIGVMRIVIAFELKRLPEDVDAAFPAAGNGAVKSYGAPQTRVPVGQS